VTSDRIAQALAQFVRSLESWDSKYDRAAAQATGNTSANFADFSEAENLGKSLFFDGINGVAEFGCAHCHVPPTFGMPQSFNNGLDLKYKDSGLGALNRAPNDPFTPSNDGKFKAPALRNVALSAPYMHDGRMQTLEEVVAHYSRSVQPHENLGLAFENQESDRPMGFQFTDKQQAALVAFLKTLTDERFVNDPRFADPFVRLTDKQTD
jgi:cytochrome c peroxidase